MYKLNNKVLHIGTSFTHDGILYPRNWLQKSTEEERTAIGIVWEDDPVLADDRYYWNGDVNMPKELEDKLETKPDGTPLYVTKWNPDTKQMEDTEEQVVTHGLKHVHTQQVKQTAGTLLASTDWYITRKAEVGTEIPANVVTYRAAVRTECDRLEAEINATTSVEDLINILSTTNWPEL